MIITLMTSYPHIICCSTLVTLSFSSVSNLDYKTLNPLMLYYNCWAHKQSDAGVCLPTVFAAVDREWRWTYCSNLNAISCPGLSCHVLLYQ